MFTRSRRWFAAALAVSAFCLLSASSSSSPESRSQSESDIGAWDRAQELGFRIVHAVHVPGKDRVMTWAYSLNSSTLMHEIEIDPWTTTTPPTATATFEVEDGVGGTSSFCAGNEQLADGRLFVVGGVGQNNESAIYDQWADSWYKVASMKGLRYYPSATTLPDGRVFVTGGAGNKTNTVEIYDPKSDSWDSKLVRPAPVFGHYYPRIFVLPSGKLGIIYIYGPPTAPYTYDFVKDKWTAGRGVDGDLLPVEGGPAAMYEPGKVMIAGHDLEQANAGNRATRLVDFTVDPPRVRTDLPPKAFNSAYNTLTILPDGTVLSVGGRGEKAAAVYTAELWNPATEPPTWTTLATMKTPIRREYHSVAVLLRDGRVFTGGGEPRLTTAEIYKPPYLFKSPRPTISAVAGVAPEDKKLFAFAAYGSTFDVTTPDAKDVARVSLIRLGAFTHANNWGQRFMWLGFDYKPGKPDRTKGKLVVQAPANANLAPPGFYMLFVLNADNVPSVGAYVCMGAGRFCGSEYNAD